MLKSDFTQTLIDRLTEKYPSLTDRAIKESIDAILNKIKDTLLQEGRLEIRGFGTLDLKYHEARLARDPRTGEKVQMTARHRLYFKAAKKMKLRLNATSY